MTAKEARELVKASNEMVQAKKEAEHFFKLLDAEVEKLAKRGETNLIVSDCDKDELSETYFGNWSEHKTNFIRQTLFERGFITETYYNGASHLKVTW